QAGSSGVMHEATHCARGGSLAHAALATLAQKASHRQSRVSQALALVSPASLSLPASLSAPTPPESLTVIASLAAPASMMAFGPLCVPSSGTAASSLPEAFGIAPPSSSSSSPQAPSRSNARMATDRTTTPLLFDRDVLIVIDVASARVAHVPQRS